VASDAITYSGAGANSKIVTIGVQVYTSTTTPAATAYAYKPGADETTAAQYLSECINASGTAANFGTATVKNPDVVATQDDVAVILTARVAGSMANGIVISTDESNASAGAATLGACTGANGSGSLPDLVEAGLTGLVDPKAKTITLLKEII
jgi:hypothetical protein